MSVLEKLGTYLVEVIEKKHVVLKALLVLLQVYKASEAMRMTLACSPRTLSCHLEESGMELNM